MATLNIISNFELETVSGTTVAGKHGAAADAATEALEVTVAGTVHRVDATLATATVATVYDDDNDLPADWDYLFYWADQDSYIQIIGPSMNVIFKVEALTPFWLPGFDSMVAAADATIITGGAEPTMSDIDSIVIGNYSGTTMNYSFCVID